MGELSSQLTPQFRLNCWKGHIVNPCLRLKSTTYLHNLVKTIQKCVSASLFTSARLVVRLVTPAGNCTVLSMESNLMAICLLTKPLEMNPLQLFSLRLELVSTYLVLCL